MCCRELGVACLLLVSTHTVANYHLLSPISAYWTLSLAPQKCINEAVHLLAAGCINTTTDFIVVLLPITTVIGLDLPRKQVIIVSLLFAVGLLATTAGAVRTYFTWIATTTPDYDTTWHVSLVWLSSLVELYLSIVSDHARL